LEDKKVFKFLQTFNKRKLNRFEDYLNSPYFNKSEELCFIYEVAKKYIQSSSKKSFQELLGSQLPKNKKPISTTNLDKYLSRIFQFALDFVAMEQLKEKDILKSSLLMAYLTEGDELNMFDKIYVKTKTMLSKEKLSFDNLMNKYLLERQKANYLSLNNEDKKSKSNLQQTVNTLDEFYLSQKYYLEMAKQNIENVASKKFNYYLIERINETVRTTSINENVLLNLLIKIYRFSTKNTPTLNDFKNIKDLVIENGSKIDDNLSYNLTMLLKNMLPNVFEGKNKAYTQYRFKLNKQLLDAGLLFYKGQIYLSVFKNIVEQSIFNNELEWCKKFVQKHSKQLTPQNIAIDMKNYALARLEFYGGNYESAREYVVKTNFSGVNFKLAVRRLEIMIYQIKIGHFRLVLLLKYKDGE